VVRMLLAILLATCGVSVTGGWVGADPGDCPPNCDRIPDSGWIEPTAIPLYPVYHWPQLAGLAVAAVGPRAKFEEECATPPLPGDPRVFAVGARALVPQPDRQWQLQVQVMHWRGDVTQGGQSALSTIRRAALALRACQLTAPATSPSVTVDLPDRLAAVISVGAKRVLHQYLIAQPRNSTVVELAMWASVPPAVPWPSVSDPQVFDAMAAPLCTAYIGSCP